MIERERESHLVGERERERKKGYLVKGSQFIEESEKIKQIIGEQENPLMTMKNTSMGEA